MNEQIKPARLLTQIMKKIYRGGYTTTSGGNLSLRDDRGNIWMTPSSLDKGALQEENMVCITPDGKVIGNAKPSCEYPFHLKIYELRPEIRAIVHAHPGALVSLSLAHRVPDALLFPLDWHAGKVGRCGFGIPGSQRLMNEVGQAFLQGCDSVIMENHGAIVTSDKGLDDAFRKFESMIRCAEREWYAWIWDIPRPVTAAQADALKAALPGPREYFTPCAGGECWSQRKELVRWLRRAGEQKLFTALSGGISVRVGEDDFLINTEAADRYEADEETIAEIYHGRLAGDAAPEKTWSIHRAIYQNRPEFGAVITAYCPYITAVLSASKQMDTSCMPESALVLRRMPCMELDVFLKDPGCLASLVSPDQPTAGLRNGFFLVAGKTLKDAFDAMEVAEFSARSVIEAGLYGGVVPLETGDLVEMKDFYGLD